VKFRKLHDISAVGEWFILGFKFRDSSFSAMSAAKARALEASRALSGVDYVIVKGWVLWELGGSAGNATRKPFMDRGVFLST